MLNKKQAITLQKALVTANAGSSKILSAVVATKTGKLTASAHRKYSKDLKHIKSIAAKAERHLINSFKSTSDLVKASKIDAVEKLLSASAELSLRAKIMSRVLADADELSELPDGEGFDADDVAENVECEDELGDLEASEDEEVEADDDEEIEADDDDEEVEADDDEEIEADDDEEATDPVTAKRRALKRASRSRVSRRISANRKAMQRRKSISASAKMARVASVKGSSLQSASKSLINWDFTK